MTTIDANSLGMKDAPEFKPWYRHGMVWFIIAFPAVSVLLGIMMITLSLTTNNSLVVDDYYKEGKAINQRIERDARARELGVYATINSSAGTGITLDLASQLTVGADAVDEAKTLALPAALHLRWEHVTRSDLDGETLLLLGPDGLYRNADVELPSQGRWRFHIDADHAEWRLVSKVLPASANMTLTIEARAR